MYVFGGGTAAGGSDQVTEWTPGAAARVVGRLPAPASDLEAATVGETLAALQLLVNLVVSKQTGHREHVIVDAEGYRARREANLRSMAMRIANQVRRSGQPMAPEALPPNAGPLLTKTPAHTDAQTQAEHVRNTTAT